MSHQKENDAGAEAKAESAEKKHKELPQKMAAYHCYPHLQERNGRQRKNEACKKKQSQGHRNKKEGQ